MAMIDPTYITEHDVLAQVHTTGNYCTDTLKLRCVAFVAGKFSGRDVVPENRRNQWIGGYRLQTILSTILDNTKAEGVIVWAMEEDVTDQDLAKWIKYMQRMVMHTTIPELPMLLFDPTP